MKTTTIKNPAYDKFAESQQNLRKAIENQIELHLLGTESKTFDFTVDHVEVSIPETDNNENVNKVYIENGQVTFECENVNDNEIYDYQSDIFSTDTLLTILQVIEDNF